MGVTVRQHLRGATPTVRDLFRRFAAMVRRCGPFTYAPVKTRIGFQVRMTFADVVLKKDGLHAYVILARRLESPRFTRIESPSPRNHAHHLEVRGREDLDEVQAWLEEAYRVGSQEHLRL